MSADVQPRGAHVDDFLARKHVLSQDVRKWLAEARASGGSGAIKRLARRIEQAGPEAIEAVAQLMLDPDAATLDGATALLLAMTGKDANAVLERLIDSPATSKDLRKLVAAVLAARTNEIPRVAGDEEVPAVQAVLESLDALLRRCEREEVAAFWISMRREFDATALTEALSHMVSLGHASALPILRIEALRGPVEVTRMLSERLSELRHEEALAALALLSDHSDMTTRLNATESIRRLLQAMGRPAPAGAMPSVRPPGQFLETRIYAVPETGEMTLHTARRMPDGHIKSLLCQIDYFDRGLTACQGALLDGEDELREICQVMRSEMQGIEEQQIDENATAYLAREADRLTIERRYRPSDEFAIWEPLLAYPYHRPEGLAGIRLGLECCVCAAPVRRSRAASTLFFGDMIAVCGRCARRKPPCAECGRKVSMADALVDCANGHEPRFVCSRCADLPGDRSTSV